MLSLLYLSVFRSDRKYRSCISDEFVGAGLTVIILFVIDSLSQFWKYKSCVCVCVCVSTLYFI